MVVRAPLDGIVVMQTIFRGGELGQIREGDQIFPGQPFMRIVDPGSMLIDAVVNQVDADRIRVGAKATVRLDAYPELELPASVRSIGALSKTGGWRANYVREVPVTLKLEKTDPRIIPDLSASADVVLATEKKATLAPMESIFRDQGSGQPYVFLRTASGWQRHEVQLGQANFVSVAIRSGLKPGDVIAVERPLRDSAQ
jgi:hypothetical protein